ELEPDLLEAVPAETADPGEEGEALADIPGETKGDHVRQAKIRRRVLGGRHGAEVERGASRHAMVDRAAIAEAEAEIGRRPPQDAEGVAHAPVLALDVEGAVRLRIEGIGHGIDQGDG